MKQFIMWIVLWIVWCVVMIPLVRQEKYNYCTSTENLMQQYEDISYEYKWLLENYIDHHCQDVLYTNEL